MQGEATRLCVFFEFAEMSDYTVTDEDIEFAENVFEEHDLYPDRIDEYNIYSEYFPDSDVNMESVNEIESQFKNRYTGPNINRYTVHGEEYGVPPGTYQTWLAIQELPETHQTNSRRKSGGEKDSDDTLKRDSELRSEDIDWKDTESPEWRSNSGSIDSSIEWKESRGVVKNISSTVPDGSDEISTDTSDEPDDDEHGTTSADWEPWYPCPECGSTTLLQTQVAEVYATEHGNYGGEDPDFDEKIECAECRRVLL